MTKKKVLLFFIILFISSCSETIQTNGLSNIIITEMQVKIGITTKNELNKKYGPPVFEGIFNNNILYYISHESGFKNFSPRKTKKLLMHKIVSQCFLVNDQPKLKKTVDHKNRLKSDWSLDNLLWDSQKNNSKNKG